MSIRNIVYSFTPYVDSTRACVQVAFQVTIPISFHRFNATTPNLPTNIVDFRGFDSSIILILRVGILRSIGDFPESLTRAMLVGCNVSREIGRKIARTEQRVRERRDATSISIYISVAIPRRSRPWLAHGLGCGYGL